MAATAGRVPGVLPPDGSDVLARARSSRGIVAQVVPAITARTSAAMTATTTGRFRLVVRVLDPVICVPYCGLEKCAARFGGEAVEPAVDSGDGELRRALDRVGDRLGVVVEGELARDAGEDRVCDAQRGRHRDGGNSSCRRLDEHI